MEMKNMLFTEQEKDVLKNRIKEKGNGELVFRMKIMLNRELKIIDEQIKYAKEEIHPAFFKYSKAYASQLENYKQDLIRNFDFLLEGK